jgi:dihydroorotase
MECLLKQVKIIDSNSPFQGKVCDIVIKNGKITDIGEDVPESAKQRIIREPGLHVSPGWMDVGVWVGEPGNEHVETLNTMAQAAVRGGFTTVAVLPNTIPALDSKSEIQYVLGASNSLPVQVLPFGAISIDTAGIELAEILDMQMAGAIGFTDGTVSLQHPGLMMRALHYARANRGLIINHPYIKSLGPEGLIHEGKISVSWGVQGIPSLAEEMMLKRDIDLLRYTDSRLHALNISTRESVQLIREAKEEGLSISASVAAMNLLETDAEIPDFHVHYKVLPPLRGQEDRRALIDGLKDGTLDFITSNHRPVDIERKKLEFAYAEFGAIGLQTAFSVVAAALEHEMKLDQIIRIMSIEPRNLFSLPPSSVKAGQIADMTLFNPDEEWTFEPAHNGSKAENSPYFGKSLKGKVYGVVRGRNLYWFGD